MLHSKAQNKNKLDGRANCYPRIWRDKVILRDTTKTNVPRVETTGVMNQQKHLTGNFDEFLKDSADDDTLTAESKEELKTLLMKMKEENEKASLKLNIRNLRVWHLVPLHMANRWGKRKSSDIFYFLGSKITMDDDYSHKIVACSLEEKL